MAESNATLRELRKISKILLLTSAQAVEKELSKIANTDARKKMWVLIDGNRTPKDISKMVGVTEQAVYNFINAAVAAELVENPRGQPPRKILDYVPPSWIELLEVAESKTPEKSLEQSQPLQEESHA